MQNDYIVLSVDFQEIPTDGFANGITFSNIFTKILSKAFGFTKAADKEKMQKLLSEFRQNNSTGDLDELFECLSELCGSASKPIVLMIDEVDSASNNQVFYRFFWRS